MSTPARNVPESFFTAHGFKVGPVEVQNAMEYRGVRVLRVLTDSHELEIAISPKGNNIRVWRDGVPLTEAE